MKKRGAGRPRDVKPEATRQAILVAAERCFSESGFAGTPTRRIASKAGVNVATLHYHFGSKEKLYRDVLGGLRDEPPAGSAGADASRRLAGAVEALFDRARSDLRRTRLRMLDRLSGGASDLRSDLRLELLERSFSGKGSRPAGPLASFLLSLIDASALALKDAPPSLVARARAAIVRAALAAAGP